MKRMTRRDFLKKTSAAVLAGAAAPRIFAGTGTIGGKGSVYPDQRRKYTDSKTGHIVWQMTDTPGRLTHAQYFTQLAVTPDGEWMIYGSDRANDPGQLNLFKINLKSGESVQLTDSTNNVVPRWSHLSPDGKEVYYIENLNHFKAVDVETYEERSLCIIENCHRPHQIGVSPDNKFIIDGVFLEKRKEENFLANDGHLIRSAIVVIDTKTGQMHRLLDGNTPRTHVQHCPADPNLILYCYGGPWWRVQRMWLINTDGSNNRPIFIQTNFEGAGHEFWSENGKKIYVTCNGGRQPQGLWAYDVKTGKERCVLAGSCVGHGAANGAEDRFVIDDMYMDGSGLWMARKGSIEPKLLCQTGKQWYGDIQEVHPHSRFLPDGKTVAFTATVTGKSEVYLIEI
jgi:oligogalacturonide lyase